ncbi:vanadium-dependent haloperoxidase [Telluria mixta]|uniref:Vanadium-dependent haloperoxidase n=1 Tax=Telluria mixta TaxID=34071 RepID=A0ABT2BSQ0_9BURK|nr:vanadium-dependent haloperoxidase [Telluria mixta]MCS0628145.1 vanadium-dependent haloperoxidase [Telluria mixta]WEM93739.1 vanadium-dependent haloperoxidase [Telluria mixta]
MERRTFLRVGSALALGNALAACGGGDTAPQSAAQPAAQPPQFKAVVGWNQTALQAIRNAKPGPPMAARSLAVMHTSMYNAWAAYSPVAVQTPHGPRVRRPESEQVADNKTMAMSHAAYRVLLDQFPTQKALFDSYMASLGYDLANQTDLASPQGIGQALAAAMLDYCHKDGSNQLGNLTPGGVPYADYTGYVSQNPPLVVAQPTPVAAMPAPGNWQPLTYTNASGAVVTPVYLAACWGNMTPFALASADQYRPGPPAAAGTPEYAAQAQHIVDVQAALTERQKVIAEYWADGPASELPPGHWCLLAQSVSTRDGNSDDQDVLLFFALANALSDAAIAAWDAKRAYDSERPITAVRYLMQGKTITGYGPLGVAGGLRQIAGETWVPYQPATFPTPPFPEHVSGHSTFSAAAAEVLRRFTGSDAFGSSYTKPAHSMAIEPALPSSDVTLNWATFSAAADEAGLSRVYGGIHFDNANVAGKDLGRKVGALVFNKAQRYWMGQA